jgi:hypothetical protein
MMYVLSDVRVMNSRRMSGVGHVTQKGKKVEYKILVKELEGK